MGIRLVFYFGVEATQQAGTFAAKEVTTYHRTARQIGG